MPFALCITAAKASGFVGGGARGLDFITVFPVV
jgi:hypothetical protein